MNDDDIRNRFHDLAGTITGVVLKQALYEKDIEYMRAETAKIQKAVEEQKEICSKLTLDVRTLMIKATVAIAIVTTGIGICFKIFEMSHKP